MRWETRNNRLLGWMAAALLLAPCSAGFADTPPHDARIDRKCTFTISPDKETGFKFTALYQYRITYLSTASLQRDHFIFTQEGETKVSKITFALNGKQLGKSHIASRTRADLDQFLSDDREYALIVPQDLKVGDSVSYSFRKEVSDITYFPTITIPNENFLNSDSFEFHCPDGMTVTPHLFSPRNELPLRRDEPSDGTIIFHIDSLEATPSLPYYPFNAYHGAILFTFADASKEVSHDTPEEFARWYWEHTPPGQTLAPENQGFLSSELAGTQTQLDQARLFNDWVRTNIRYLADESRGHAIFPHLPDSVLASRLGDCKDRAALVRALGFQHGFNINLALVSVEPRPTFDVISPGLYDHVICSMAHDDTVTFFDPTGRFLAFPFLRDELVDQTALVLDPEHPHAVVIPNQDSLPQLELKIHARLDSLTVCQADVVVRGRLLGNVRYVQTSQIENSKDDAIAAIVEPLLSRVSMSRFSVIDDTSDHMTLSAQADLSRFVIPSDRRIYVPKTPFPFAGSDLLSRASDTVPIYFDFLQDASVIVELDPRGLTATTDSLTIGGAGPLEYAARVSELDQGYLRFEYRLKRLKRIFAGQDKVRLLEFARTYLAGKSSMFTLQEEVR